MILHHEVSGLRSEVDVAVGAEAVIVPICLYHLTPEFIALTTRRTK